MKVIFRAKLPHRSETGHYLFSEQPKEERQDSADQKAGDDGEIEAEIAPAVVYVSRQSPGPALAKSRPDQQTDSGDNQAEDKQHFARFVHGCAIKLSPAAHFSSGYMS